MDIFKFQQDLDQDDDGIPDFLEIEKLKQTQLKDNRDYTIKQKELGIKEKELAIKKQQANNKPSK